MTEKKFDNFRGYYGTLGDRTVIKNCSIIKDVKTGTDAYLKGANKLKNLTINSSSIAPSQIGEGCELVNGIIGMGCRIFYGVKAVRFIMGSNSQLKYGARLINSFLGDNATISCCEVLNALIFPAHEQHHNNSFLIAATVEGQSNIAAGATIGSNHNSRGADGEIVAGRGFWPALCTSIKHNSRFAPFTILAKADYPAELNITMPFSLVSNDQANDRLVILPAYWFMYNMYALARNSWKLEDRDKRPEKNLSLETNYLAPDTVNSIFEALHELEFLTGNESIKETHPDKILSRNEICETGRKILLDNNKSINELILTGHNFEHGKRHCLITKVSKAYHTYREQVYMYAVEALIEHLKYHPDTGLEKLSELLTAAPQRKQFTNVGGQLLQTDQLELLRKKITNYEIISWDEVHTFYHMEADKYVFNKFQHAIASLVELTGNKVIDKAGFGEILDKYLSLRQKYGKAIEESRLRDYNDPFRQMVYENKEEMYAVLGKPSSNTFIKIQNQKLNQLKNDIASLRLRFGI
jgi:hypothetical protein